MDREHFRTCCAYGLNLLGTSAAEAEPVLLAAMGGTNINLRFSAAIALGRVSTNKSRVVPVLLAGLKSTGFDRDGCIFGLTHCVPGDPAAAAALRRQITHPRESMRRRIPTTWSVNGRRSVSQT